MFVSQHLDYLSLQALLFRHATMNAADQIRLLFYHTRRLSD